MSARLSFDHELELLNTDLIKMGALVEDAITKSIEALKTSNHDMAREIWKRPLNPEACACSCGSSRWPGTCGPFPPP